MEGFSLQCVESLSVLLKEEFFFQKLEVNLPENFRNNVTALRAMHLVHARKVKSR